MNQQEILNSKFDFETHSKNFICYCEVIITPNGEIRYAVPSHEQAVLKYLAEKNNMNIEEIIKEYNALPLCDIYDRLLEESGCILVWYDRYTYSRFHIITEKQFIALKNLELHKCCEFRKENYEIKKMYDTIWKKFK